jgi:hypothetical protein
LVMRSVSSDVSPDVHSRYQCEGDTCGNLIQIITENPIKG